jgi:hypothetical protein
VTASRWRRLTSASTRARRSYQGRRSSRKRGGRARFSSRWPSSLRIRVVFVQGGGPQSTDPQAPATDPRRRRAARHLREDSRHHHGPQRSINNGSSRFAGNQAPAVGLSGVDAGLIKARKRLPSPSTSDTWATSSRSTPRSRKQLQLGYCRREFLSADNSGTISISTRIRGLGSRWR